MIVAGVALLGCGLFVLKHGRWWRKRQDLHIAGDRPKRRIRWSQPTRLLCGVLLLMAGYHAIVWAFPEDRMPLQLPRRWWWAWVLVGTAMVPASLALDQLERNRLGSDGED